MNNEPSWFARRGLAAPSLSSMLAGPALAGVVLAGAVLASAQPASAQLGNESGPRPDVQRLVDQADTQFRKGNYAQAAAHYESVLKLELDTDGDGELTPEEEAARPVETQEYRLSLALCRYESGQFEEASKLYEYVRRTDPNNASALMQLARARANQLRTEKDRSKKEDLRKEVKDLLEKAAKQGANSLRAIRNYKELSSFATEYELLLALIKAPQTPRTVRSSLDPFRNPIPVVVPDEIDPIETTGPDAPTGLTRAEQRERVAQLEVMLSRIEALIEKDDYEGMAKVWVDVQQLTQVNDAVVDQELQEKLRELMGKLEEKEGVVKSLLLRAYFEQGERQLFEMSNLLQAEKFNEVSERWRVLNAHAKQMIETDEEFGRAANDLLTRGQVLERRAELLKQIHKFQFAISGVVKGSGVSQAIINNRVTGEQDSVYDHTGSPIPNLKVVTIGKSSVRFRFHDHEFERKVRE